MGVFLLFIKLLHSFIRLPLQESLFVRLNSLRPPFFDGLLREHQTGEFLSILGDLLGELVMLPSPFGLDVPVLYIDEFRPDWDVIDVWFQAIVEPLEVT